MVLANLVLLRSWTGIAGNVNLRLWRTPDALIWALIVAGFAMFLPLHAAALAARNLFVVLLGCYFGQGLAIVSYYLPALRSAARHPSRRLCVDCRPARRGSDGAGARRVRSVGRLSAIGVGAAC